MHFAEGRRSAAHYRRIVLASVIWPTSICSSVLERHLEDLDVLSVVKQPAASSMSIPFG
jgi:hypothetical protein